MILNEQSIYDKDLLGNFVGLNFEFLLVLIMMKRLWTFKRREL
jgi:hypothetical protein